MTTCINCPFYLLKYLMSGTQFDGLDPLPRDKPSSPRWGGKHGGDSFERAGIGG